MASPELERARYGKTGKADHFVGFWLSLIVEARGYATAGDARRVHRSINRFLADSTPAAQAAGVEAFHEELLDAAERYWDTTRDDPTYSSTLFGLKRISREEFHAKVAKEAVQTVQMLSEINLTDATAKLLPCMLVEAMLRVVPESREAMRVATARRPAAQASVGHLLEG